VEPVKSGLIFASINLFFYLITWGEYTLLSLGFYGIAVGLFISMAYTQFQIKIKSVQNPLNDRFSGNFKIAPEVEEANLAIAHDLLDVSTKYVTDLVLCKNLGRSIRAVFVSYILSSIFGWFEIVTLIWLASFLAFAIPPVYQMQKELIDAKLAEANKLIKTYKDMAMAQISQIPVLNTIFAK
jgi:hypothetical protein